MRTEILDAAGSLRRSHTRLHVLLALSDLETAYLAQLERTTGHRSQRVRAALIGGPGFRSDVSLVALGLAEEVPSNLGRVFRITQEGARVARRERRSDASSRLPASWPGLRFGMLPHVP